MTSSSATRQVIHFDFISLAPGSTAEAIDDLVREAAGLASLPGVEIAGVIRAPGDATPRAGVADARARPASSVVAQPAPSGAGVENPSPAPEGVGYGRAAGVDFDIAFFFVLDEFAALEPFGTDPAYTRFLQGRVARLLRGFAGSDVALRAPFPEPGPFASCLALAAPDETYDWEVWTALEQWAGGALAVTGLAIGERQRYRGCVLKFSDSEMAPGPPGDRRFQASVIAGPCRRL